MRQKNAVAERLDVLHDQWVEFARQPEARLLRWVVEPQEARMLEAWLEKETDEEAGECPDLLLRFDAPFEQSEAYGWELRKALEAMVAESGEPVRLGEVELGQTGAEAFLSACEALQRQYEEVCEVLAVVLVPQSVSSAKAWQQWLWRALEQWRSPRVRLVVLEDAHARVLEPMAQMESRRVWTAVAGLDVVGAMQEVAQQAGAPHAPESRYRELLLRVARAAQQGELREVGRWGGEAVAVAEGEGWHGLAAAAHWAVAGALLAAGQPHEAAERYRQAEAQALQAEAQGEAQGAELRLRTRLALGAALVVAQQWASAAALYEETAPQARKLADAHLELECWRMGSFCRESLSEWDRALENGRQAWEVGKGLLPQVRATSTLPYVAEALVRLNRARLGEEAASRMEVEAESVLGKGWRSGLNTAGSQAA
jgi:hypothetical protein